MVRVLDKCVKVEENEIRRTKVYANDEHAERGRKTQIRSQSRCQLRV